MSEAGQPTPGAATSEDLAVLAACWRSLGLRAAVVEWELDRPALLRPPLASRLRSALGPALAAAGVRSATLDSIPGEGPPALWFLGWDCPPQPQTRLRAEIRCVGAVASDWTEQARAMSMMRFPGAAASGALVRTVHCEVTWQGGAHAAGAGFGPPLVEDPELQMSGGACLVEAVTPLQLTDGSQPVTGPPPFPVLVRSAGDRFRRLCVRWGSGAEALPPVVGRAYWEAAAARFAWGRAGRSGAERRSGRSGLVQRMAGLRGVFSYERVTPLAMAVLTLGAELGVGKGTAFGCGQLRVFAGQGR